PPPGPPLFPYTTLFRSRLLGLDHERERSARALALLRAGGMRAGFGSDAKALGVGLAAAAGVQAARLAAAGAQAPLERVADGPARSEEHTSELQSQSNLV